MFKLSPKIYPLQSRLTLDQIKVVKLMCLGMTARQIASSLCVMEYSVNEMIINIMCATNCSTRMELVNAIAAENKSAKLTKLNVRGIMYTK